jgi:hypothetical protein
MTAPSVGRRGFLRSALVLSGGLLVGDGALEAFARLTHVRKSFPSAVPSGLTSVTDRELQALLKEVYLPGCSGAIYVLNELLVRSTRWDGKVHQAQIFVAGKRSTDTGIPPIKRQTRVWSCE